MDGYKYFAEFIKGAGITHFFYIEAILRMAVREMSDVGVKCIMTHSENAAGYMADGYARITGKPGVCGAQSIGAANLAAGIYDASLANSPVIAITGKKAPSAQYKNSYQELNHKLLYEEITKFNVDSSQPEEFAHLLRYAFRSVTTGKPGPAHIDITNHIGRILEVASMSEPFFIEEKFIKYPAYRPSASEIDVSKAAKAINEAKRPIIVVGRGAVVSGAKEEIYNLAVTANTFVTTTPDGKTVIDENDKLWAGIAGGYGMDCANKAIGDADLVIFIGTQISDQTTHDWKIPNIDSKIVQIDIEPTELGKNYPNTIGLHGDVKTVLKQLINKIEKVECNERYEWHKQVRQYIDKTLDDYSKRVNEQGTLIRPERLIYEINKVLPDDAIVVSDTGYSAVWTSTLLRMKPSQSYLRAAGSLGWSFPASLGVKCGAPDRPVVCITGDGGFFYHLAEMETAVRCGINTVTVINNNNMLAQCLIDINNLNQDKPDKGTSEVVFSKVNFAEVAKSFGCVGMFVERPEEISAAVEKAIGLNKPVIIEVITDGLVSMPPSL